MNLKDLQSYNLKGEQTKVVAKINEVSQPSFFAKSLASMVDTLIVTFIRIIIGFIVASILYKIKLREIIPTINPNSPSLVQDLIQNGFIFYLFIIVLSVILLGGMYYVIFLSSKYSATLGQMLFDIKLVDRKTLLRISFARSLLRYICYLVPIFLIILIVQKYFARQIDISFFIIALMVFFWYDFGIFLKIKIGMPDLISRTVLISTKPKKESTKFKIPFFK